MALTDLEEADTPKHEGQADRDGGDADQHLDHVSVFAMPVHEHRAETKPYLASKGTLHFPIGDDLPAALLTKLVKARAKIIDAEKR